MSKLTIENLQDLIFDANVEELESVLETVLIRITSTLDHAKELGDEDITTAAVDSARVARIAVRDLKNILNEFDA